MTRPRLWGEWESRFYGSGTTIVVLKSRSHRPHLYIYADSSSSESRYQGDRIAMCEQIADFLNGDTRPAWLDDFDRATETFADTLTGASIQAIGPMLDIDPPNLIWKWDDSEDAKSDRAKLLDTLFLAKQR